MYLCKSTGLPIEHTGSGFKGYDTIDDEYTDRDPRMTQTFLKPGTDYISPQDGPLTCPPQFTTRPETRTGYKLWKFMAETSVPSDQDEYDYHIIRYAEVLLILAEATYEKDGSISDEVSEPIYQCDSFSEGCRNASADQCVCDSEWSRYAN